MNPECPTGIPSSNDAKLRQTGNDDPPTRKGTQLSLIAGVALTGLNFIYAGTGVFSKMASAEPWLSPAWMLWMAGTVLTLFLYALLWQRVLRRVPVATAYVFRGTVVLFALLLSHWLFGEAVTTRNLVGAALIVGGIALYARG